MELKAMAKINVGLDVIGKRPDGYHDVRMIMQSIKLYDKIALAKTKASGIRIKTNLSFLPVDENNLVYKAAKMLGDEFAITEGIFIQLDKYIPVAAGLAGGSSDAAAVLVGMNHIFNLGLSQTQLMERGVKIGADVPFCIMRGTVLAEGIGEKLTPLDSFPESYIVVVKPKISVSTRFVYENLHADTLERHPDIDGIADAIKKNDLLTITQKMENVLETVTEKAYPIIADIKETLLQRGALNAMMSGSGPSVFGIFSDKNLAQKVCWEMKTDIEYGAKQVFFAEIYNSRRR